MAPLLFLLFLGLTTQVYAGVTFTASAALDYDTQYMWNYPPADTFGSATPSGMIAADGMTSFPITKDITMFMYYDTVYGYFNYTNKAAPYKNSGPVAHYSFAPATIVNGKWVTNMSSTPGWNMQIDPHVTNNWYWPEDGIVVGTKFHLLVEQSYAVGMWEYGNISRWLTIENVLANPQTWTISSELTNTPVEWDTFADDGLSDVIYVYGKFNCNGNCRVIGAVSRADLGAGIAGNVQCWTNLGGTPQWSCDCSNPIVLYNESIWQGYNAGRERWNPFLKKWIRAVSFYCELHIFSADTPTGPWTISGNFWHPNWEGLDDRIFCYAPNLHPTLVSSNTPSQMVASLCTWDFTNYYDNSRPYHRHTPSIAPKGDVWVYLPFALRLNFTITGSYAAPANNIPTPSFQRLCFAGSGTGLTGDYYTDRSTSTFFDTYVFTRVDPTVNFNWGSGVPDSRITADNFAIRWTGQVQPLCTATYTFYAASDDGVRLYVNGQSIVNAWVGQGVTEYNGNIALVAGRKYDVILEYMELSGGAEIYLSWSSSCQSKQVIPKSQLYACLAPSNGGGDGLTAKYYSDRSLTNLKGTQVDKVIDVNWGWGGPSILQGQVDNYSVRWSGFVQPRYTGLYKFYAASDDGARIYVNGVLVVDSWYDRSAETSGSITLLQGVKYSITYEYYEASQGAEAHLSWSSSCEAKAIIPQSQLFSK